jgi:hypothetical protein
MGRVVQQHSDTRRSELQNILTRETDMQRERESYCVSFERTFRIVYRARSSPCVYLAAPSLYLVQAVAECTLNSVVTQRRVVDACVRLSNSAPQLPIIVRLINYMRTWWSSGSRDAQSLRSSIVKSRRAYESMRLNLWKERMRFLGHGRGFDGPQLELHIVNTHSLPVKKRGWTYPPSSSISMGVSESPDSMWTSTLGAECRGVQMIRMSVM